MKKKYLLSKINFSIFTAEEIKKLAEIEVLTHKLYDKFGAPILQGLCDPRFGTVKTEEPCVQCDQTADYCSGHFGYYELIKPVLNINFLEKVKNICFLICYGCSSLLISEPQKTKLLAKEQITFKLAQYFSKKLETCPSCSTPITRLLFEKVAFSFFYGREKIPSSKIYEVLLKIKSEDKPFLETAPSFPLESYFVKLLLIPPIQVRPSVYAGSLEKSEDDLTLKLADIIRTDLKLRECIQLGSPQLISQDIYELLEYHVSTYFNNQTSFLPVSKHRSGRPLSTFVQRLKGKEGRFRFNLVGKRVNFSARATLVPDPKIRITELVIPEEIAQKLYKKVLVSVGNIEEIRQNILEPKDYKVFFHYFKTYERLIFEENKKTVAESLIPGDYISRNLIEGDFVLFNRQPTLHRYSILALKILISKDTVFKINPVLCPIFNADFDGDEMNIHVPQTLEAEVEMSLLMKPNLKANIFSVGNGRLVASAKEDAITNLFYLTYGNRNFTKQEAASLLKDTFHEQKELNKMFYSGREIFSFFLPNLNLVEKTNLEEYNEDPSNKKFIVEQGRLISGVVDKLAVSEQGFLLKRLFLELGVDKFFKYFESLLALGRNLSELEGYSLGILDLELPSTLKKQIRLKQKGIFEIENYLSEGDKLTKIFNISEEISKELKKNISCSNPFYSMVLSGGRGSIENFNSLSATIGQQFFSGGRFSKIGTTFEERTFSFFSKKEENFLGKGYIFNSYSSGLNPIEYFIHSSTGREGLIDTSIKTAETGYTYRKLIFAVESLCISKKQAVVDGEKKIIQFKYGGDGLDPSLDQFKEHFTTEDLLIEEGTAVGILAAQSFGEPLSQMNLRTFHGAGGSSQSAYADNMEALSELLENKTIFQDKRTFFFKLSSSKEVHPESFFEKTKTKFLSEFFSFELDKELIYIKYSEDKDLLFKLFFSVLSSFDLKPGDFDINKQTKRIYFKKQVLFKKIKSIRDKLEKTIFSGKPGFLKLELISKKEKLFKLTGGSLSSLLELSEIDPNTIDCNCPREIYANYGIEGVRDYLYRRILVSFEKNKLNINKKHVSLLCDALCFYGVFDSITRTGLISKRKSPLFKASFETPTAHLIKAAVQNEQENLQGATENVLLGQKIPFGTGFFEFFETITK